MKIVKRISEFKEGDIYLSYINSIRERKKWIVYKFKRIEDNSKVYGTRLLKSKSLLDDDFTIGEEGFFYFNISTFYKFDSLEDAMDYLFVEEL